MKTARYHLFKNTPPTSLVCPCPLLAACQFMELFLLYPVVASVNLVKIKPSNQSLQTQPFLNLLWLSEASRLLDLNPQYIHNDQVFNSNRTNIWVDTIDIVLLTLRRKKQQHNKELSLFTDVSSHIFLADLFVFTFVCHFNVRDVVR